MRAREIASSKSDAAIASTIIAIGQHLGLKVIAEGVETKEQCQQLMAFGCDEMQGYYLEIFDMLVNYHPFDNKHY